MRRLSVWLNWRLGVLYRWDADALKVDSQIERMGASGNNREEQGR
jgi:hypothetical protein